jgi:predicted  nucleic acid-binding Zn-ribbon protein
MKGNQMSDTPRTDTLYFWRGMLTMYDLEGEMKKFERELNAANTQIGLLIAGSKQQERQIEFLNGRVKELEDQLNAANKIIRQQQLMDEEMLALQNRIQRLVEAGDRAIENLCYQNRVKIWKEIKAKEVV